MSSHNTPQQNLVINSVLGVVISSKFIKILNKLNFKIVNSKQADLLENTLTNSHVLFKLSSTPDSYSPITLQIYDLACYINNIFLKMVP